MYRLIIETEIFMAQVDDQRDKNLLEIIQQAVLADINLPPVNRDLIQGSGGFAKLRVADPKRSKGKSGGYRVIYFDLPKLDRTILFFMYAKSVKENLSQKQLAVLKAASQELKSWQPIKKRLK